MEKLAATQTEVAEMIAKMMNRVEVALCKDEDLIAIIEDQSQPMTISNTKLTSISK